MTNVTTIAAAIALHEAGAFKQAIHMYREIIKANPTHFQAHNLIGLAYQQCRQDSEALHAFEQALTVSASHALTHFSAGASALRLSEYSRALVHLNHSLVLEPADPKALTNKGIALHHLGDFSSALRSYENALRVNRAEVAALFNAGCTLQALSDPGSNALAVAHYELAVALEPQNADYYINLGNALKSLNALPAAVQRFKHALILIPPGAQDAARALYNKGTTELLGRDFCGALASLSQSSQMDPTFAGVWNNLGNAHKELGQLEQALTAYARALVLSDESQSAETHCNRGIVLHEMGQYEAAVQSYDVALRFDAKHCKALNARAITFKHLKQFPQAVRDFERVLQIDPQFEYALGNLLHTQMHIADWSNWGVFVEKQSATSEEQIIRPGLLTLQERILKGQTASHPFPLLALYDDPALHLQASTLWAKDKHPLPFDALPFDAVPSDNLHYDAAREPLTPLTKNKHNDPITTKTTQPEALLNAAHSKSRIRLAYVSADFHNHATAYLIAELLERHDRERFEVFAISLGPCTHDHMQTRIQKGVEHFRDVSHLTDKEIALLCRSLRIDIAIDLKGYTLESRFNIFRHRCAPVQVSYIGYPGTSGSESMDYLIGDRICIPPDQACFYTENLVYMPHSYQVNDRQREITPLTLSRADLGLRDDQFVFCCFNNTYKITPPTFARWMSILKRVERSVLWLLEDSALTTQNLRASAVLHGVDPERLVFAQRWELGAHLGRHAYADLFLDTLPYNAHTTASDALWAGLPVLTLQGSSFAARVASSLLHSVGLNELITQNVQTYYQTAVDLAHNPSALRRIKSILNTNRLSCHLFDTDAFTHDLENAYQRMYDLTQTKSTFTEINFD